QTKSATTATPAPPAATTAKPAQTVKTDAAMSIQQRKYKREIVLTIGGKQNLWAISRFGGEGETRLTNDTIQLDFGDPLTGVYLDTDAWETQKLPTLPTEDFEIQLDARRTGGFDFFCALTFPVGQGRATLVCGGWAGVVTGISSIDGDDASSNATKTLGSYKENQWYNIRLRVTPQRILAWVDNKKVVDHPRGKHKFDIRAEMELSTPIGVAAFQSDAEIKNVRLRVNR
ncbi:MAG: family 16 glycoside hydrolase, partial [Planctomycetota bacterium]